jgi:hypothetical protein
MTYFIIVDSASLQDWSNVDEADRPVPEGVEGVEVMF